MNSSESFKNKVEDTSSSSQPPLEPSYLSLLRCLSPIRHPLEDLFSFDEHDFLFTTPGLDLSSEVESDIIGGKSQIEDTNNINKLSPLSEEPMMAHQETPAYADEPGELPYIEWPSQEPKEDHELQDYEDYIMQQPVNELQDYEDYILQHPINELQDHEDYTPQLMPDPLQENVNQYEDNGEMRTTFHVSAENLSSNGSESMLASPKHRDIRRRLRFEKAASNGLGGNNYPLPTHIPKESESSAPSYAKGSKSSSSFGIHLNSLMKATPPVGSAEVSEIKPKRGKFRLAFSLNKDGQSIVSISKLSTIEKWHEIVASVAADTVTSMSLSLIEPLTPSPYPVSAHVNKTTSPTDAGNKNSEKFKQPRPPAKKRPNTNDTDDLQRCKCKRSTCMKLYCDCFAAKLCCTKSCTCQGCLNRPEHRDHVFDARRQIIARNPLGFAPKIVQNATNIPSNNTENDNLKAPSSARHIKGCCCKKSKCMKKYCECFEGKCGCCTACRCEGCENSYGKKEGYIAIEDDLGKEKGSDLSLSDLIRAELEDKDVQDLLPITPSLQCSDKSQSSVSLTNGSQVTPTKSTRSRIFTLHGVASFQPKTPCIDSKVKGNATG